MGDLVTDRRDDAGLEGDPAPEVAQVGPSEDRDLARDRRLRRAEGGPRDALVQSQQPAGARARELVRPRLILDDDGHAAETFAELGREALEGFDHERLEVDRSGIIRMTRLALHGRMMDQRGQPVRGSGRSPGGRRVAGSGRRAVPRPGYHRVP
jgi:hypothetical protein